MCLLYPCLLCTLSCHVVSGRYDYDFMDYTIRVLYKCKEYGFKVYLDPHQDAVRVPVAPVCLF